MDEFKFDDGYFGYIEVTLTFLNKLIPKTIFKEFAVDENGNQKKWKDVSRLFQVGNKIYIQVGFFNENGNRENRVEQKEFELFFNYFSGLIINKNNFEQLQNNFEGE